MELLRLYRIYRDNPLICTDSRRLEPQCLFFCLKGERFDGNAFAEEALEKGARFVITARSDLKDPRVIQVPDPLLTLQELARHHRRTFTFPVLALAGSNGKTTTKELLKAVLRKAYRCHATPGNYNNHIGVPLTLLATPSDTDFLVVEMGANHLQETDFLCKLAEPTYGLVTNNGLDHLEGFGSPENVARANAELYEFLKATGGVAFVNMADASLVKYSEGVQRVAYNVPNSMAWDNGVQEGLQAAFLVGGREKWIKLNMFGRHNVLNALAALCVGRYFGVPENDIYQALESYQPTGHRSAILSYGGAIVVSDCYNANPSSMEVALEEFLRVAPAPRTVILGDMWELGSYSAEHHLRIIHRILNAENLQAILCGPLFTQAAREVSANLLCFESVQSLKNWFSGQNWQGHHILLKGSRGMSLEKLLE